MRNIFLGAIGFAVLAAGVLGIGQIHQLEQSRTVLTPAVLDVVQPIVLATPFTVIKPADGPPPRATGMKRPERVKQPLQLLQGDSQLSLTDGDRVFSLWDGPVRNVALQDGLVQFAGHDGTTWVTMYVNTSQLDV